MWRIKYNSGYSLFFEYTNSDSYKRNPYTVYVNNQIVHENITVNTFSIFRELNEKVRVKIVSEEIEFEDEINLEDDNYYLDVKSYILDMNKDVTTQLQALILSAPKNTTLFFQSGTYKLTSLFLKSDLKIVFAKECIFDINIKREDFPILPDMLENKEFTKKKCISSWEGNPQESFSSIITGYNIQNVEIVGNAQIKCNGAYDNWWHNPKQKNIAWRPKTIFLNNCKNIIIHGLQINNSPSWTIHPFYCENICFFDIYIKNVKDSPNTDGINPESCEKVEINGCNFNLGDDCIAIKSGKLYMAENMYKHTDNIKIINCKMEHGHGAIVLGSEISCGVENLEIKNCFFNDTDRGLRVKTRRGRGEKSVINNIVFKNIDMENVRAPITINAFYRCDPDGDSDYVASREKVAEKKDVPVLGKFLFDNINCDNIHQVICMSYGLPEREIEEIKIKNSSFSFAQNPIAGEPLMMRDTVAKAGVPFELLNVKTLVLENNKYINANKDLNVFMNVKEMKENNDEYIR